MGIDILIGILLWIGIYTIIARICDCFERCYITKYYSNLHETNNQGNKKITVEDLYPKENPND